MYVLILGNVVRISLPSQAKHLYDDKTFSLHILAPHESHTEILATAITFHCRRERWQTASALWKLFSYKFISGQSLYNDGYNGEGEKRKNCVGNLLSPYS